MNKKINFKNRATLKGSKLEPQCKTANTTTHEYGENDNRIYCYGLYSDFCDYEVSEKCRKCGAYVYNAKPLEEEEE